MRGRIARQHAGMHGNAGPGDPLHVRHRRAAIDVGVVEFMLLDDAEHTHRRRMALHAGRHRGFREHAGAVVDRHLLPVDRHDDDQRPLRLGAGFLPGDAWFLACGASLLRLLARYLGMPVLSRVIGSVGIIRPIIERCVCLAGRADRTRRRQNGDLPKPRWLGVRTRRVHAVHSRIQNPNQTLVSRRGYAFTSRVVLPSVTFVQDVAKKPHGAVNGGRASVRRLPVGLSCSYIAGTCYRRTSCHLVSPVFPASA